MIMPATDTPTDTPPCTPPARVCAAPPLIPPGRAAQARTPRGAALRAPPSWKAFMTIVTTGRTRTRTELAQMITALEAKAALAQRNGLRHTAKSWRDTIVALSDPILETDNAA